MLAGECRSQDRNTDSVLRQLWVKREFETICLIVSRSSFPIWKKTPVA